MKTENLKITPKNRNTESAASTPKTKNEMEAVVREICLLRTREQQLTASLDAETQRVREQFESPLAEIQSQLELKTAQARTWAERNTQQFGDRRSVDFLHGIVGFRIGPPKVKTLGKCKWDSVLEALRLNPWGRSYIRVKEEINKEKMIADVSDGFLSQETLRESGAQVVRDEMFFVEPRINR